jgi:hypothetical protein
MGVALGAILHSTFCIRSGVACISIRNTENGSLRTRGTLVAVWYHHGPGMVPSNHAIHSQKSPPAAPNSPYRPPETSTPLMEKRNRFPATHLPTRLVSGPLRNTNQKLLNSTPLSTRLDPRLTHQHKPNLPVRRVACCEAWRRLEASPGLPSEKRYAVFLGSSTRGLRTPSPGLGIPPAL